MADNAQNSDWPQNAGPSTYSAPTYGSYLTALKSRLTPTQFDALLSPLMRTANEFYGGNVQDYQAQLLMPIDVKSLGIPQKLNIDPGGLTTDSSGERVFMPPSLKTEGIVALTDDRGDVNGYTSAQPVNVNGVPVSAIYDVNGNLTNYIGDNKVTTWTSNKDRIVGSWDASGRPTPGQLSSSSGGFAGMLHSIMSDPILGAAANVAAAYFGGPLGSAALSAAQGKDLGDIAKSAALSYAGGEVAQGVGGGALGQFTGNTATGLLSGQDLGTSLSNAALSTGANQAASGLLSSGGDTASVPYSPTTTTDYTSGADYSLSPLAQSSQGLQGTLAPVDMSNPYAFNLSGSGGLGLSLGSLGFNLNNNITGNPLGQDLAGLTTGAENYLNTGTSLPTASNPNPVAQSLLAKLLSGAFSGNTGTNNMATTTGNNLLGGLLGSALTGAGGLMQGSTSAAASQAQANALRAAGQQASQQAQFRPVGTTTTFGTSNFQVDPTTGQLTSAGYNLSPEMQAYQNQIMGSNRQSLTDASTLQNLGRGYIGQNPNDVAANWYNQQQALLAPSRDTESARLANQLQQTGRTGVSVAQGGALGAANPEQQALANARAMADAQMAANAQQYGQQQVTFGQGLLSNAYQPFNAGLTTASNVESLAQQPLNLSSGLAQQSSASGARAGQLQLGANTAASQAALNAGQYNPYASALSGLGGSSLFGTALGSLAGNTSLGSSLGNWLGSNIGSNLSSDQFNTLLANNSSMAATPNYLDTAGQLPTLDYSNFVWQ
jgi:hypothetical protein